MTHLLDTNVWVEYLRGQNGLLSRKLIEHWSGDLCLSSISAFELLRGAQLSSRSGALAQTQAALEIYEVLPFTIEAAAEAARLTILLERKGLPIGRLDVLIAATALEHDLVLVSHNTREFSRIPGLKLEDWQEQ